MFFGFKGLFRQRVFPTIILLCTESCIDFIGRNREYELADIEVLEPGTSEFQPPSAGIKPAVTFLVEFTNIFILRGFSFSLFCSK